MPKLMKTLRIKFFDTETTQFFQSAITETMRIREQKGIVRKDMIHLLMDARKGKLSYEKDSEEKIKDGFATVEESHVGQSEVKTKWEDDDLTAQCFIFFFAGFDTVRNCKIQGWTLHTFAMKIKKCHSLEKFLEACSF